jgi:arylsulfatase A-like enzyme
MGRYCQPYGFAVPTPTIQRLAERGVLFRQAHCSAPTCSASRAALLTGQSAHSSGMLGLAHRGWRLHDYRQHILHTLRSAGYHSALAGVQHIAGSQGASTEDIGYDEIVPYHGRDDAVAAAAANWLKYGRPDDKPWFLSAGFFATHRAFTEPDPSRPGEDPRYVRPPLPLPDNASTRHDMAAYNRHAAWTDRSYAAVLQALVDSGQAENTLVICTTDHGIAFPHMKCNLTDHGTGVTLIMAGPGEFSGGKVTDALTSQIDVFPTVCDYLDIEAPDWLEGKSLMPVIRGDVEDVNEQIYTENTYHAAYEPMRAVRTQRYKYIRRFMPREAPVLPNCDSSVSKTDAMEQGWQGRKPAMEQLYDLSFDPNEACNIAGESDCADILADLRSRLDDWMKRTNDPLLDGPVALPEGGMTNPVDAIDPDQENILEGPWTPQH